jgi:hypothetical protein
VRSRPAPGSTSAPVNFLKSKDGVWRREWDLSAFAKGYGGISWCLWPSFTWLAEPSSRFGVSSRERRMAERVGFEPNTTLWTL